MQSPYSLPFASVTSLYYPTKTKFRKFSIKKIRSHFEITSIHNKNKNKNKYKKIKTPQINQSLIVVLISAPTKV